MRYAQWFEIERLCDYYYLPAASVTVAGLDMHIEYRNLTGLADCLVSFMMFDSLSVCWTAWPTRKNKRRSVILHARFKQNSDYLLPDVRVALVEPQSLSKGCSDDLYLPFFKQDMLEIANQAHYVEGSVPNWNSQLLFEP